MESQRGQIFIAEHIFGKPEEAGYDTFWFETIKSVGAFRKVDKEEVYYIDKISDTVNKKIQSSEDFLRLVKTSVKKFTELEL